MGIYQSSLNWIDTQFNSEGNVMYFGDSSKICALGGGSAWLLAGADLYKYNGSQWTFVRNSVIDLAVKEKIIAVNLHDGFEEQIEISTDGGNSWINKSYRLTPRVFNNIAITDIDCCSSWLFWSDDSNNVFVWNPSTMGNTKRLLPSGGPTKLAVAQAGQQIWGVCNGVVYKFVNDVWQPIYFPGVIKQVDIVDLGVNSTPDVAVVGLDFNGDAWTYHPSNNIWAPLAGSSNFKIRHISFSNSHVFVLTTTGQVLCANLVVSILG